MPEEVTQCPKCKTSFRVTEAQLKVADGTVRCGSCLHIFHAPDYWLGDEYQLARATEQTTDSAATDESYEISNELFEADGFDDDNKLFQDTIEQKALDDIFDDKELEEHINNTGDDDKFFSTPSTTEASNEDDDSLIGEDNNIIEHTLISSEDLGIDEDNNETGSFSKTFLNLDGEQDALTGFKDLDDLGHDTSEQDESWANKLLEDEDSENTDEENKPDDDFPDLLDQFDDDVLDPELQDILNERDEENREFTEQENTETITEDEFVLGEALTAGERIGGVTNHNQELLENIEPAPVEISAAEQRSKWLHRGWVLGIILATLGLIGQYIFFNFEQLARDNNYRPTIISTCGVIGCTVPALHDINQIRASNLVVRTHPTIKTALVVDAIITNRADFQQTFPLMELQFTDLSGKVVASRRFKPTEYLGGELTGISNMPIKQPVHISLAVVDPGEQAVNYQLQFYPPDNS